MTLNIFIFDTISSQLVIGIVLSSNLLVTNCGGFYKSHYNRTVLAKIYKYRMIIDLTG